MKNFGGRLKKERENKKERDPKWTQGYTADLIGVSRPTYTAYENGTKQPPMQTLNKIADIFEVSTDYLLCRTDDRKGSSQREITDPSLNIFFKEIKEESPERQEQLRKIWEIIKNEGK